MNKSLTQILGVQPTATQVDRHPLLKFNNTQNTLAATPVQDDIRSALHKKGTWKNRLKNFQSSIDTLTNDSQATKEDLQDAFRYVTELENSFADYSYFNRSENKHLKQDFKTKIRSARRDLIDSMRQAKPVLDTMTSNPDFALPVIQVFQQDTQQDSVSLELVASQSTPAVSKPAYVAPNVDNEPFVSLVDLPHSTQEINLQIANLFNGGPKKGKLIRFLEYLENKSMFVEDYILGKTVIKKPSLQKLRATSRTGSMGPIKTAQHLGSQTTDVLARIGPKHAVTGAAAAILGLAAGIGLHNLVHQVPSSANATPTSGFIDYVDTPQIQVQQFERVALEYSASPQTDLSTIVSSAQTTSDAQYPALQITPTPNQTQPPAYLNHIPTVYSIENILGDTDTMAELTFFAHYQPESPLELYEDGDKITITASAWPLTQYQHTQMLPSGQPIPSLAYDTNNTEDLIAQSNQNPDLEGELPALSREEFSETSFTTYAALPEMRFLNQDSIPTLDTYQK